MSLDGTIRMRFALGGIEPGKSHQLDHVDGVLSHFSVDGDLHLRREHVGIRGARRHFRLSGAPGLRRRRFVENIGRLGPIASTVSR